MALNLRFTGMRPLFIIFGIFILLGFTSPKNAAPSKPFISWSADRPVQWSDFQGKPDAGSREAAMTASSIEFTYESSGIGQVRWEVKSKFFPELSWSKKTHRTDRILQHEQLHFDITEVYARLMRKRFHDEIHSVKEVSKFKSIAKQVMDDWNQEQIRYDKETKHSIHAENQALWNKDVAARLEALKSYSAESFTIQK